jgi:hypothetical protein
MLEKISMLDSQVIRALLLAITGLVGLILSFFGVDEGWFSERATRVVDAVLLIITTGGVLWAGYARRYLPTPPITDTAVAKTEAKMASAHPEGGFVRPGLLVALLAFSLPVVLLPACTNTREAYRAAETPDEVAYVITEHYASLVREAANLRQLATTPPEAVAAMQRADLVAGPLVDSLRPLRDAYMATRSAESEAELQEAVNRAVLAIADLVRHVKTARGDL